MDLSKISGSLGGVDRTRLPEEQLASIDAAMTEMWSRIATVVNRGVEDKDPTIVGSGQIVLAMGLIIELLGSNLVDMLGAPRDDEYLNTFAILMSTWAGYRATCRTKSDMPDREAANIILASLIAAVRNAYGDPPLTEEPAS